MKSIKLISAILFLISCSISAQQSISGKKSKDAQIKSKELYNILGSYIGVTRCANCDGLETELILKKGNEFTLSIRPINTSEEKFVQKGKFSWNGKYVFLQGTETLATASIYFIKGNEAKQIYNIDNELKGENWTGYTLKKR